MYKYLNAESTAVVHLPTSRCIYLDQPSTIHTENYVKWRDGWTETIPAKTETVDGEEVITPEQTINHPAHVTEAYVAPPPPPPLTPEQIREQAKAAREVAVAAIKVTTQAGNTFDGDEISQGRMARAVIALSTGLAPSVTWVLADNSVIQATTAELTEALVLAGQAQAAIWVI